MFKKNLLQQFQNVPSVKNFPEKKNLTKNCRTYELLLESLRNTEHWTLELPLTPESPQQILQRFIQNIILRFFMVFFFEVFQNFFLGTRNIASVYLLFLLSFFEIASGLPSVDPSSMFPVEPSKFMKQLLKKKDTTEVVLQVSSG